MTGDGSIREKKVRVERDSTRLGEDRIGGGKRTMDAGVVREQLSLRRGEDKGFGDKMEVTELELVDENNSFARL